MHTIKPEHTPAEIVNLFPRASDLFKEHGINFCCQGDRPLHTVLEEKKLDEAALLEELNDRYKNWNKSGKEVVNWNEKRLSDIVDHIIDTYHSFLQEELPLLEQFVTRVFQRHGGDQPHLVELFQLYGNFKSFAEEHTIAEENKLFPLVKEYETNPNEESAVRLLELTRQLEQEHETETDLLKRLREITNAFTPPAGACNTYRITYARLEELEENTLQQVHLENNVLLKRVKKLIA